jgi:alkylglycerol monooxygenase
MDLIALAAPFFIAAIAVELGFDRARGRGLYRRNDALNSLSLGMLSSTTGYFTRLLTLLIWGLVLENFALFDMPVTWFDWSARGITLWLAAAIGWDFCYYWFHRCSHEMSILWAAHAVHHQSEDYNLSTALRQTSTGFLFGWIFYLPLFVLGFPLQILLAVGAINLIYQFWVHTQFVRRLGMLDYLFVTPSNHRVHHAQNARYIDKNYGGVLIIWDRLFATFEDECEDEPVVFGVRKPLANLNPLWANLQVYDYLLFDAVRTRSWRDKLGLWFRRTGWRPADVAAAYPRKPSVPTQFSKYDPVVAPSVQRYVLMQFILALILVLGISVLIARSGPRGVLVPCLVLWSTLVSIGLLNDGRARAVLVESARLLLIVPLATVAMQLYSPIGISIQTLWAIVISYIVMSLIGLFACKSDIEKHTLSELKQLVK